MKELKASERKYLRSLAHSLKPVVLVGLNGMTEQLITAVIKALDTHELIKIKFNKFKDDKKEICSEIESRTNSSMVGLVGNVAIFFKQNEDEEKRKIFFD